ncbi:MAG: hypothetical protein CM15mP77_0930 [Synechococcus sp.]|nr:MAG: hypothetical protein CM15mP77_0930 [Synechococcus sp.]
MGCGPSPHPGAPQLPCARLKYKIGQITDTKKGGFFPPGGPLKPRWGGGHFGFLFLHEPLPAASTFNFGIFWVTAFSQTLLGFLGIWNVFPPGDRRVLDKNSNLWAKIKTGIRESASVFF